jgi:hypothetical protein
MSLTSYRAAPPRVNFSPASRAARSFPVARLRCRSTGCCSTPRQLFLQRCERPGRFRLPVFATARRGAAPPRLKTLAPPCRRFGHRKDRALRRLCNNLPPSCKDRSCKDGPATIRPALRRLAIRAANPSTATAVQGRCAQARRRLSQEAAKPAPPAQKSRRLRRRLRIRLRPGVIKTAAAPSPSCRENFRPWQAWQRPTLPSLET